MSDSIKNNYMFVSQKDAKFASVMIKDGKFKDVIYKYGKVSIGEEEDENGNMPFRVEYNIIDNVGIPREEFGEELLSGLGGGAFIGIGFMIYRFFKVSREIEEQIEDV